MRFRFKLKYSPKDGNTFAELLGRHSSVIEVVEMYEKADVQFAVCQSDSLGMSLAISREIGAEIEILHGDGEFD